MSDKRTQAEVVWIGKPPIAEHATIGELIEGLRERTRVRYLSLDERRRRGYSRLSAIAELAHIASGADGPIVIDYFQGAALLAVLLRKHGRRPAGYLRTRAVVGGFLRRLVFDSEMAVFARLVRPLGVIHDSLARLCRIRGAVTLPIGARFPDCIGRGEGIRNPVGGVYVGTLENRKIDRMVTALTIKAEEITAQWGDVDVVIAGAGADLGWRGERSVRTPAGRLRLYWNGPVDHGKVQRLLCDAAVGIAYIPMTPWYEWQPPKKTLEYLLAGLIVVGTRTQANREILSAEPSAVLVGDEVGEFGEGLLEAFRRVGTFSRAGIQQRAKRWSWKNLIEEKYLPFLASARPRS